MSSQATLHIGLQGKADTEGATPLASPDTGLDDCYRIAVGDVTGRSVLLIWSAGNIPDLDLNPPHLFARCSGVSGVEVFTMRFILFVLLVVFTMSAFPSAAESNNNALEHMTVTASRNPIPLWEAGSALTVIDRVEIERRQTPYVVDLLRSVPGLSVNQQGGAGKFAQIRVRGAEANQVLVMIDGVEVNDTTRADDFDFSTLTTSDIERIEVVRGPQSSLWGSDALAGVINIITRQAIRAFEANASAEGGSFGTKQFSGGVGHRGETYSLRLGANHLSTGGTNVAVMGDEDDGYRSTSLNAKADWQAHEALRFDASARVTDIRNETDTGAFTGIPADSDGQTDTFLAYAAANARASLYDGGWTHWLGGTWSRSDNKDRDLLDGSSGRVQGDKYSVDYQTTIRFATPQLFGAAHSMTFAIDFEERYFKQRGPIVFGLDPNQNRKIDTIGYVGEYRLRFFDETTISGSVRHDDNSDFDNVTTFRVSLSQRLSPWGTVISGAYGTGQKDPTFFDRFGFSAGGFFPFVGNSNLTPEKSKGWEVAIQQPLFDDRVLLGATVFSERLEDEINGFVIDFATSTSTAENVDGKSHRDGVELFANAALTDSLSAAASYTYLDANQIDRTTGIRSDEVRRARHQGAASLNYTFQNGRGNINAHLSHTGDQDDDIFLPPVFARQRVSLNNFTLFGLSGSWQLNDQLNVFARAENILDDEYQEVFGFQAPGASVYLGVRYTIGR